MGCMCIQHLQNIGAGLRNLPREMLANLAADQLGPLNQAARLAPSLSAALNEIASAGIPSMSAASNLSASASANLAASMSANLGLNASAMASLEALAAVNRGLGMGALNPRVASSLSVMIQSVNLQAPDMLAVLEEFLQPISAAIDRLQALAASLQGITAASGMNLATPLPAFPAMPTAAVPSVQANASAMAAAGASASAQASAAASASASAQGMLALRVQAASMALGYTLPGQSASLNGALALTTSLPALNVPQSSLQSVSAKLGALAATMSTLGVNLLAPTAGDQLVAALRIVNTNLQAMASANLSTIATANLSAAAAAATSVAATAAANLNANAILSAAANLNLAIPNLQPLATSLAMAASLSSITGSNTFASRPCSSCKVF